MEVQETILQLSVAVWQWTADLHTGDFIALIAAYAAGRIQKGRQHAA